MDVIIKIKYLHQQFPLVKFYGINYIIFFDYFVYLIIFALP